MKLPFLKQEQKQQKDYFLSLLLRDTSTHATVFEEIDGKIHIIGQHEEHFSQSIETLPMEELLEKLDKAISTAESKLPKDTQTSKTLFGVKTEWVEDNKIKKEYLQKLKKVSQELGLSPIGFLVISEAIPKLLHHMEGAPVSGLLVEIHDKTLEVSLLRAGKVIESHKKALEDNLPKET